jgi:ATP-dependent Clp protease ATP-binding subunit ClpA
VDSIENRFYPQIKDSLDKYIIWQEQAKNRLSKSISNVLLWMIKKKGPMSTMFFHWPTGVWKSEMASALSTVFFGDPKGFIKVQMEQFR